MFAICMRVFTKELFSEEFFYINFISFLAKQMRGETSVSITSSTLLVSFIKMIKKALSFFKSVGARMSKFYR